MGAATGTGAAAGAASPELTALEALVARACLTTFAFGAGFATGLGPGAEALLFRAETLVLLAFTGLATGAAAGLGALAAGRGLALERALALGAATLATGRLEDFLLGLLEGSVSNSGCWVCSVIGQFLCAMVLTGLPARTLCR